LRVTTPFPSICVPDDPALIRGTAAPDHDRIAVIAVALEADAGSDVEAIFAALGETDGFSVWTTRSPTPNPRTIGEAARASLPPAPEAACVRMLRAGEDLEDGCLGDDWVGACLVVQPVGHDERSWRMHFASRDGRNDWTAAVRVRG
jgi:hypothetical protein